MTGAPTGEVQFPGSSHSLANGRSLRGAWKQVGCFLTEES